MAFTSDRQQTAVVTRKYLSSVFPEEHLDTHLLHQNLFQFYYFAVAGYTFVLFRLDNICNVGSIAERE